jgi:hypothetical protein
MVHHNIRLYPFDTEDNDDEEVQLNDSIRVCNSKDVYVSGKH